MARAPPHVTHGPPTPPFLSFVSARGQRNQQTMDCSAAPAHLPMRRSSNFQLHKASTWKHVPRARQDPGWLRNRGKKTARQEAGVRRHSDIVRKTKGGSLRTIKMSNNRWRPKSAQETHTTYGVFFKVKKSVRPFLSDWTRSGPFLGRLLPLRMESNF